MSAKRPRPAIPVLVHVDNPTEAASVTVDTSTIEGKMDTVINNQERIYDKIPTSSGGGGGSADLTTVNENTTSMAETIGSVDSNLASNNLFGAVKNLSASVGDFNSTPSLSGTSVRSYLYSLQRSLGIVGDTSTAGNITGFVRNLRDAVGSSAGEPSATGNSVRDLLSQIKTATGTTDSGLGAADLLGLVKNVRSAIGPYNTTVSPRETTVRSFLYNLCQAIGDSFNAPTTTENTVRGLLTAIKENTASGDDLTTVNEKITAINAAVGDGAVLANDQSLIGLAKGIKASLGSMDVSDTKSNSNIKGRLFNIQSSIGDALNLPSPTGTSVRDLLAAIKANTASGGGGSADLTTVNEKTTALATAIGSADDDSSTVSVIGLLKSITDKY